MDCAITIRHTRVRAPSLTVLYAKTQPSAYLPHTHSIQARRLRACAHTTGTPRGPRRDALLLPLFGTAWRLLTRARAASGEAHSEGRAWTAAGER